MRDEIITHHNKNRTKHNSKKEDFKNKNQNLRKALQSLVIESPLIQHPSIFLPTPLVID